MATIRDLLRKTTDYYDTLHPAAQFGISYVPGLNILAGAGQMDKYATQGDVGGMGVTALGTLFPPFKTGKRVADALFRRFSPTGTVMNAADAVIELPEDDQAEWDAMRAEELRRQGQRK